MSFIRYKLLEHPKTKAEWLLLVTSESGVEEKRRLLPIRIFGKVEQFLDFL